MRILVSTLFAVLLAGAGRAELVAYSLHDATLGNDPHHAVNAVVSGQFYLDTVSGRIAGNIGGISFWDNGYGSNYAPSYASELHLESIQGTGNSLTLLGLQYEKYILYTGQIAFAFTPAPGVVPQSVNLDPAHSFVRIAECTAPGPGGCNGSPHDVDLYFTSGGFVSTIASLAPAASTPEPGTWLLSATCCCLFASCWKRRPRRS